MADVMAGTLREDDRNKAIVAQDGRKEIGHEIIAKISVAVKSEDPNTSADVHLKLL